MTCPTGCCIGVIGHTSHSVVPSEATGGANLFLLLLLLLVFVGLLLGPWYGKRMGFCRKAVNHGPSSYGGSVFPRQHPGGQSIPMVPGQQGGWSIPVSVYRQWWWVLMVLVGGGGVMTSLCCCHEIFCLWVEVGHACILDDPGYVW